MKKKGLYRITPRLYDKIWGGYKLAEYGKGSGERIGESWELSFTDGCEASIGNTPISEAITKAELGENCRRFEFFPVLTKFIDAAEKLSVQVHPSDDYALKNEGQYGKTEMWYVVSAEEGSGLYVGLKREVSAEEFMSYVESGRAEELLDFKPVKAGDVYFIPSGTIHAIGGGVLIFEIQQNSTLTYRIYDYMRRDDSGNLRELHLDKAMKVSHLKPYEALPRDEKNADIIGKCDYFETRKCKLEFTKKSFVADESSFVSVSCVKGEGTIDGEPLSLGDTYLVAAGYGEFTVEGNCELLLVSVPEKQN